MSTVNREIELLAKDKLKEMSDFNPDSKRVSKPAPRFTTSEPHKKKPELVILKGNGVRLGEIPYIKTILEKKKSDELMILHRVLYGDGCKKKDVKKNIREFSGVVYGENLDKAKLGARVERVTKTFSKMRDVAKMLGVEGKTTKEDLKDAIVAFLEAPADHGAVHKSVVKKAEKEEKKEAKKVVKAAKKAGKKEAKKSAKAEKPLKPLTAYMIFSNEKRPELVKKFPDLPVTEIAKKTGELWKNADKEAYKAKAEKMKEECEAASKKAGAVKKQNKKAKKAKKEEKKEVEEEETEEKEDMEEDEEKEGEDAKEK